MAFGNKIARTYGPSYLSRASDYLAGLLRADKAVRSTNSKIDSAVKGLLSAKERIPTITAGQIAKEDSEEANKKSMDILEKLADQSVASNHVGNIGAQFDLGAPMTATAVRLKSAKAIKFLHEKMPKAPVFKSLQPNLESKKWKVTSLERARFNRYVRAVTDPMSVLDEMRRGIVNIEGIETLRSIYPALHADLSNKLISASAEKREELPYKTRVALGALIGAVTDTTLNPRFTATMMDIRSDDAASSEERASGGVRPTAGAMSKMKFAEQAKTNVEKRLG
jgi:hypothetical protein